MKNLYLLTPALVLLLALASCGSEAQQEAEQSNASTEVDATREKALAVFAVLPQTAENPTNELSEAKIKLGKVLYFDTRLSKDGNISCNSCHDLNKFGVDNLATSPGDLGKNGGRNSPTVLNAALHSTQFWDGREPDVEAQAGGPVLNPIEMNIPTEEFMVKRLGKVEGYVNMFKAAFPDAETAITYENMRKAIAAFERTLLTPSRFDQYLAGEDVFTETEKKGLETFMNTGCTACHRGTLLGGDSFQKFAYNEADKGRFDVTKEEKDMYMFKTQSLRNIEKTFPYFHDGGVANLDEAVKIMAKQMLSKELSEQETAEILAFLKTLTGELPADVMAAPELP